jgi:hypothetical protein
MPSLPQSWRPPSPPDVEKNRPLPTRFYRAQGESSARPSADLHPVETAAEDWMPKDSVAEAVSTTSGSSGAQLSTIPICGAHRYCGVSPSLSTLPGECAPSTPMLLAQHEPFGQGAGALLSDWHSNWRPEPAKADG